MRVLCPSCAAVYEVPEPLLGAGSRTLRCGRCGTEWVLPGAPAEVEPLSAAPEEAKLTPTAAAEPPPPPAPEPATPEPTALEPVGAAEPEESPRGPSPLAIPPREGARERPFALGPAGTREAQMAAQARAPRRGRDAVAWFGWLVSLALLALLVWAGYAYRGVVMHAWPPSQRLYALLGLGPTRP